MIIRLGNYETIVGFPGDASSKEPALPKQEKQDSGLIPGLGKSPGGGIGNPFQYSCLENSMDRGALAGSMELNTKRVYMISHIGK